MGTNRLQEKGRESGRNSWLGKQENSEIGGSVTQATNRQRQVHSTCAQNDNEFANGRRKQSEIVAKD